MSVRGKSVIVVLGMHRSGTSAITRGLQVLGVELGDHLMPPTPDVNDKGFFEDSDVNSINAELLHSLGQDWHTLSLVSGDAQLDERHAVYRLRAIELLRSRLRNVDCFGLKDPRMCRLLPFWQRVFESLELKVFYVIVVRNPLSVARSLERVHNIPPEKSHYLWLEHILPSLLLTQGMHRVLIDYDQLLESPEKQITRMAAALGLDKKLDAMRLSEFSREFLDDNLRHATFEPRDVFEDPLVPVPVRTAVMILADIGADKISLDSTEVAQNFADLAEQLQGMSQAMNYLLRLDNLVGQLNLAVQDKDVHIVNIERALTERTGEVAVLNQAVYDKDVHIGNLEQADEVRSQHSEELSRRIAEQESEIAQLNQAVHDKDVHIGNVEKIVAVRVAQVESLLESANRKDMLIQQLQVSMTRLDYGLAQVRSSIGWKLARPIRMVKSMLRRFKPKMSIALIPFSQLQLNGGEWQSTGGAPQFLLMTEYAWNDLPGWYWLNVEMFSDRPFNARLCFDVGQGFESILTIRFQHSGAGQQRIPLHVPGNCHAIRFDPCDESATFMLAVRGMEKLKEAPKLPAEFAVQSGAYEMLGGRNGNAAQLVPINNVSLNDSSDYCWRALDVDPWFLIENIKSSLRPGWYMIELHMHAESQHGNAKFYFDFGDDFSEAAALNLPFTSGQMVKRLCHLESVPKQIRFDPLDCAGKFSISHIHFAPVMPIFARNRMLRQLRNHSAQYTGQALSHIWQDVKTSAKAEKISAKELLNRCYGKIFPVYAPRESVSYADWIENVETPEFSDLTSIEDAQRTFEYQPIISVIMPTYNTAEIYLRQAIESVIKQSYSNWELCIADDASSEPRVRAVLEEYAQCDARIKVVFRPVNGHISAASNSALALASGDFIALLDHDDELATHALHFVVAALNQNHAAQIVYSDEDKIDGEGYRTDPHFKSDWNPDMFFSQNYISHLGVYRREVLQFIGGFRVGVEGSQDQDLLLRCLPHVRPGEIIHIPRVLYHWRALEGSTALAAGEKNYTTDAGIKALQDFFSAEGKGDVAVEAGLLPNTYHVRYAIPQQEPLVSLLIPTRDMLVMLEPCIRSILEKTTYQNYEIIILDNESIEPATLEYFERIQADDARVTVLPYHQPFNYSAINNFGAQHAKGEVIGLINNDIEVISPEWLSEMVSHAIRPETGCVGAKLYFDDGTIQHAGVILGIGGVAGHSHKYFSRNAHGYFSRLKIVQNLSAVTAACLLVRKSVYMQVGGLEESLQVAFNDVDFCIKVREAGYRNLWTPYAELCHHESKSRGAEDTPEKVARFNKEVEFIKTKWGELLLNDPYYSQNLTMLREDFSINAGR